MKRLLILALLLSLPLLARAELEIGEAWIKQLPPSVPVRAGYLSITNNGSAAVRIVAISSESFARIEIHRTVEQEGMMSMQPVEELSIAPGATVKLTPGGTHLMMMQPQAPTKPGDLIEITLQLDDGSQQVQTLRVKK